MDVLFGNFNAIQWKIMEICWVRTGSPEHSHTNTQLAIDSSFVLFIFGNSIFYLSLFDFVQISKAIFRI